MRKIITYFICFTMCAVINFTNADRVKGADIDSSKYNQTMKQDILCLMLSYGEYIKDIYKDENCNVYIIMKSGRKILYDDKRNKTFSDKFNNPDIQDMMELVYPIDMSNVKYVDNIDPGRIRLYPLLKEIYGENKNVIEKNLKDVTIGGKKYQFNGNNKAAESLNNVMKELIPLSQKRGTVGTSVFPLSGTFNYRVISGTNMLSPHAFGIAIDLSRNKLDYWKWTSRENGEKRANYYPAEIVKIFENNNFVWGGKWSHFDILHFEYRPEIILKARYFGDKNIEREYWYVGAPYEQQGVKEYIKKIDDMI